MTRVFVILAGIVVLLGTPCAARLIGSPQDSFDRSLLRPTGLALAVAPGDTVVTITVDDSRFPLIRLYVDVTDQDGRNVNGLTGEDFCVHQDGTAVEFSATAASGPDLPASVCLVVDNSRSMTGELIEQARAAIRLFVDSMEAYDRAAVVSFDDCVTVRSDFTSDPDSLHAAINTLGAYGLTALFDGVWQGVSMAAGESGNRAVIALTDGCDNNSGSCGLPPDGWYDGYEDDSALICGVANEAGVTVYTIGVGPEESVCPDPLTAFSAGTGGQYLHAPSGAELDSLYRQIRRRVQDRYIISYVSPDTVYNGDTHTVDVCIGGPACTPCGSASYRESCPPQIARDPSTIALDTTCTPPGEPVTIGAMVIDTCDPGVSAVTLLYRPVGSEVPFESTPMTMAGAGQFTAAITSAMLPPGAVGLDYYFLATDGRNTVTLPADQPHRFPFTTGYCPNEPPLIRRLTVACDSAQGVRVGAEVTDTLDYVARTMLYFRSPGDALFDSAAMAPTGNDQYEGWMPVSYIEKKFEFAIRARDNFGLLSTYGPIIWKCDTTADPIDSVLPTDEWIELACSHPSLDGSPLTGGVVIRAHDPDGAFCGVDTVDFDGSYGPMRIYRDDPATRFVDEGAEPGDAISISIDTIEVTGEMPVVWTGHQDAFELCDFHTCLAVEVGEGWNLISWNRSYQTTAAAFTDLLGGPGCVDIILAFDGGALTYDPALPAFSTLHTLDWFHGYWVRTNCPASVDICADSIGRESSLPLSAGWNLIGYWPGESLPLEDGWATVLDLIEVAFGFDGGGQTYRPDQPGYNTLVELSPGFGYWLKSISDASLIYPGWTGSPPVRSPLDDRRASARPVTSRRWISLYGDNITLDEHPLPENSRITVRTADGLDCGAGTYRNNRLLFTPVYGDDGNTLGDLPGEGTILELHANGLRVYPDIRWSAHGDRIRLSRLASQTTSATLPARVGLGQNYPNPFNPSTAIEFTLPARMHVSLAVYNILGQRVALLADGIRGSGEHRVTWNGCDDRNRRVSSGIYLYRLETDGTVLTRKMILSR